MKGSYRGKAVVNDDYVLLGTDDVSVVLGLLKAVDGDSQRVLLS